MIHQWKVTFRPARRLAVIALAVIGIAACAKPVPGGPDAHSPTTSSTPAAPTTLSVNLCKLLTWSALGYPDTPLGLAGPSNSGNQANWSQFCQWTSYQSDAGYTAPPAPTCASQDNSGSLGSSSQCALAESEQLNSITANSKWVNVAVGWRPGDLLLQVTSKYIQDGHTVYLDDEPASWTCIGGVHWANGSLQVEVQDATKAFGPPCDEVKKVANLLVQREPR